MCEQRWTQYQSYVWVWVLTETRDPTPCLVQLAPTMGMSAALALYLFASVLFFLYNILFVYDGIVNAVFCHTYQRCMVAKSCANKHGPGFSAKPGTMCLVQLVPTMGMSIALVRFICDCLFVLMIENTNKYHS